MIYLELFRFLLSNIEKKIEEDGLENEIPFSSFKKHLQEAPYSDRWADLIKEYERLLIDKKSIFLEKKILQLFSPSTISRGLPRLYQRTQPTYSQIKPEFTHLPSLTRLSLEKKQLSFYDSYPNPKGKKIVIFTFMFPDGWGDLITLKEVSFLLKKRFPSLSFQQIVCIPRRFSLKECDLDKETISITYHEDCPLSLFPKQAMDTFQQADLILSIPTFYPHTEELKKKLPPHTRFLAIGQYGFIESSWFHPKSGYYSMGLHFLEHGILIRETETKGDFRLLENRTLLLSLFGKTDIQTMDLHDYHSNHRFYLAYLLSPIGGAIYLHALLQSELKNDQNIDICTPNVTWLIDYIKQQTLKKEPVLQGNFGISDIEIHYEGKIHRRTLHVKGKRLRIISPGAISDADFRNLIHVSEEFIAVRGDQSFSEVVSANRLFFYDGAAHARYFIKDLVALAEHRMQHNKPFLLLIQSMGKAFLYNREEEKGEWVEETYFQEKEPWQEIAKTIAFCLKSEKTKTKMGCREFNEIIKREFAFNATLYRLIQRELSS